MLVKLYKLGYAKLGYTRGLESTSPGGRPGGWVAGSAGNKANSVQPAELGLGLGLSLAIPDVNIGLYHCNGKTASKEEVCCLPENL
jgi:hypothetical protein